MQVNPTGIQIYDVQIIDFQPDMKQMMVGVKMNVKENSDLYLPSSKLQVSQKLDAALKYLHHEGFVDAPIDPSQWFIHVFAGLK